MSDFISTAQLRNEIIDCRKLHLEMEFHHLDRERLRAFAESCVKLVTALTDNIFYLEWEDENSRRTNPVKLLSRFDDPSSRCAFIFEGYVYSDIVHDHKSFVQLRKNERRRPLAATDYSADYPEVFRQYFHRAKTPDRIKAAILDISRLEGRVKQARWIWKDIQGILFTYPHNKNKSLFFGNFRFEIVLPCMGSDATAFAHKFRDFAVSTAEKMPTISGRVALTPSSSIGDCSPYMHFFGTGLVMKNLPEDIRFDYEWRKNYYLIGAEWFNVLSGIQAAHIPDLMEKASGFTDVRVEKLENGSVIAQSEADILETDIPQLTSLKKLLYPALYPGCREIMLKNLFDRKYMSVMTKPRAEWERAPIFEDEIEVTDDSVIFRHQNYRP